MEIIFRNPEVINHQERREKERENLASKKEIKQEIGMAMKYSAVGFLVAFLSYSIGKLYRETFMIVIKKKKKIILLAKSA